MPKGIQGFQKGNIPWNKGIKRLDISGKNNHNFGKHLSQTIRDKISKAHKGMLVWNKGKRGLQTAWNKGKPFMQKEKHPLWGKHHSVETRIKISNARLGKHNSENTEFKRNNILGNKNLNWRGGITPLNFSIRSSFKNKEWIKNVLKRDNYTCQDCFTRGGNLESHHIKPFALILKEFLQQYSQFSPLEDKETLLRLTETYDSFWDINNGKTLCVDCHNKAKKTKELCLSKK